jgi:hypothetical protein
LSGRGIPAIEVQDTVPAGPLHRTHAIPPAIREDRQRPLPQEDCMGFDRIIALDLGKFNSVACVMHRRRSGQRFAGIVTTPEAMHAFFQSRIEGT